MRAKPQGFTLIELMVVLAIVGGLVVMAMPFLTNRNSEVKKTLRDMTVLSRELHTRAKLQGAVYRLVIDMQEDVGGKRGQQSFWVEKSNGKTTLRPDEEDIAKEAAKEQKNGEKHVDPRGFEVDHTVIHSPRELPRGMIFDKVELSRIKSPITSGKAYIHYMPAGLVDEAAIHIKGEKNQAWTIAIHPLTGKGELIAKPVTLNEIKSQ